MRLPLANQLKARAGTPDKDARIKNGIVEIRGESSVVRNRPGVSEAVASGLGLLAQGGMQFGNYLVIANEDAAIVFANDFRLADCLDIGSGASIMYASGTSYDIGDSAYFQDETTGDVGKFYSYSPATTSKPSVGGVVNPRWGTTPPGPSRWVASKIGYGSTAPCASYEAAGKTAFDSFYTQISCATKNPFTWNWGEYAGATASEFFVTIYTDQSPGNCSLSPTMIGTFSSGTITQVA